MAQRPKPPPRAALIKEARKVARQTGIPESWFVALLAQESINFDPRVVAGQRLSPAGAIGVGQLMPGTARGLGVDPFNWQQNLRGSARYFKQQLDRFGNVKLALSAYNSGPGGSESRGRIEGFSETQRYVRRVTQLEQQYRKMGFDPAVDSDGPIGKTVVQKDIQNVAVAAQEVEPGKFYLQGLSRLGPTSAGLASLVGSRPKLEIPVPEENVQQGTVQDTSPDDDHTHAQGVNGMDPAFAKNLAALIRASGGKISIGSGYRSVARQQQLWDEALRKYGSAAAARKWVAPPGKSNHNRGIAADLRFADNKARAWAHANAKRYGLYFPMGHEPWHIEPVGSRG